MCPSSVWPGARPAPTVEERDGEGYTRHSCVHVFTGSVLVHSGPYHVDLKSQMRSHSGNNGDVEPINKKSHIPPHAMETKEILDLVEAVDSGRPREKGSNSSQLPRISTSQPSQLLVRGEEAHVRRPPPPPPPAAAPLLFLATIYTPPPSRRSTIVWPEVLIPRVPLSACLSSTGGGGGRGDLKAPPGLVPLQRGGIPGLLKELGRAFTNIVHNTLPSGFPLNKLCQGGKGGKPEFYGPRAHVSTEEGKQAVFLVHPKSLMVLNVYGRHSELFSYNELIVQRVKQ
ncbi:hypothetical protein PAMP_017110 [Pampus punctatissimus]